MAYEGGFQIGKEIGAINIPSMNPQLEMYTKLNAQKLALQKQQEAKKQENINKIIEDQLKQNEEFIYEDKIEDVGLQNPDQAAAKLQSVIKNAYETDTFLFANGALTERDYMSNNSRRKASVLEIADIFKNANEFINDHSDLSKQGKSNFLNGYKADMIKNYMDHIAFKNNLNGTTEISTIDENGVRINMLSSKMKDVTQAEVGLNPDDIVNKLVSESGYIKYDSKSGKYRYTDFATSQFGDKSSIERMNRLIDASFEGYTDGQYMDLLNKLGGVTDNEDEAKKYGLIHIDSSNFLTKDKNEIKLIKEKAREKMSEYLEDRLMIKEKRDIAPEGKGDETAKYTPRGDGFYAINQKTPLPFKDMSGIFEVDMKTNQVKGDAQNEESGYIEAVRFHPDDLNKKITERRLYAEIIVPDEKTDGRLMLSQNEDGTLIMSSGGKQTSYTRKRVLLDPNDISQRSQILNITSYLGIQGKKLPQPY